jgi:hypothetical protein
VIAGQPLTGLETALVERILQMEDGYVLDFSDRTIRDFFFKFDVDIHSDRYTSNGRSKAKKTREFLRRTSIPLVGQVLAAMLDRRLAPPTNDVSVKDHEAFLKLLKRFDGSGKAVKSPVGVGKVKSPMPAQGDAIGHSKKVVAESEDVLRGSGDFRAVHSGQHARMSSRLSETKKGGEIVKLDVALSFAGEDRELAKALALACEQRGLSVFYDEFRAADLWGKNLYEHLADVYANQARFFVMFVSEAYVRKAWTKHEFRSAQVRALRESNEYILPIRLDDTVLPGLAGTISYLIYGEHGPEAIAEMLRHKVRGDGR